MGGDAARGTETSSWSTTTVKAPESSSWAERIEPAGKQNAGPEIADAWRAEVLTPRKAPTVNPEQELKKARESFGSLDSLAAKPGLKDGQGSQSKLESSRIQYALFPDPEDRQQIKDSLLSYYKSENKPLYEALKRLDTVESQLAKLGPKAATELAELRRQQEAFYNPYGRIVDASRKQNIPVFFPNEGDPDLLKGPFVYAGQSERKKIFLKDKTDPGQDMQTVLSYNKMLREFPNLKDRYGGDYLDVVGDKALQIKLRFNQGEEKREIILDPAKTMEEQVEAFRSKMKVDLAREYNLDFAAEGSSVVFDRAILNKKALAPTINQLFALEDALSRAKTNFVPGGPPTKVVWAEFGPAGVYNTNSGQPTIYLSPRVGMETRPGWGISTATYVAVHELGHGAIDSLKDPKSEISSIAADFGWSGNGKAFLQGKDGSKYCFEGYKDNPEDPLSPTVDLDVWAKGCPSPTERAGDKAGAKFPILTSAQLEKAVDRNFASGYFWNEEETVVDALTLYQAGGLSATSFAVRNPNAFEKIMALDKFLIARHTGRTIDNPSLVRMPDGKLAAATADNLAKQKAWEDSVRRK